MTGSQLPFFKMNGIGNSILVVDTRMSGRVVGPAAARAAAALPGLAYDQLMAIAPPRSDTDAAYVTIFNADGSEAGACGNGTRCVAWALMRDSDATQLSIETAAGHLACERLGPLRFSVDMGPPRLDWHDIPLARPFEDTSHLVLQEVPGLPPELRRCTAVSMGNPHAVFFVPDTDAIPLAEMGSLIEHHPDFPQRANVSFAQRIDDSAVKVRVWERSAGATLACGSAACAVVVAGVRLRLLGRTARVSLPGGDLDITWRESDGHVIMAGDVALEQAGLLPADLPGLAA